MSRSGARATSTDARHGGAAPRDRFGRVLKWVAAATAILTLIFGLHRATEMVTGARDERREISELMSSAQLRQDAADYAGAWEMLSSAAEIDARSEEVRHAREALAMKWLQNVRIRSGEQSFTAIVNQVAPVLARGATLERGTPKADRLAHLGWAEFLRSREVPSGEADAYYREALEIDPHNPYAHAMLAHLMLWGHGRMDEAGAHFDAALHSGRERRFVRQMQFAAYRNLANDQGDAALVRLAADMHAAGDAVDAAFRTEAFRRYELVLRNECYGAAPDLSAVAAATGVPLDTQLATFAWLFDHAEFAEANHGRREYYRGCLFEGAGRPADALTRYRLAQSLLPPASSLDDALRVAIQRVGAPPVAGGW